MPERKYKFTGTILFPCTNAKVYAELTVYAEREGFEYQRCGNPGYEHTWCKHTTGLVFDWQKTTVNEYYTPIKELQAFTIYPSLDCFLPVLAFYREGPSNGQRYWFIDDRFTAGDAIFENSGRDYDRISHGNFFCTENEAYKMVDKIRQAMVITRNWEEEYGFQKD